MADRLTEKTASEDDDAAFAGLVEEISTRVQAGEDFNLEAYAREHPEHAERLRQLMPAVQALAGVGLSLSEGEPSQPATQTAQSLSGTLGDFRIVREVARGGMGVVYEAEQISLKRRVALKVLPFAAVLDQRHLQRFKNESQAAASLRHPNIVQVFAVGCERGVHFFAMDYIEGRTLADVIRGLRPPSDAAKEDEVIAVGTPDKRQDDSANAETQKAPQAAISTEISTQSGEFFRSAAKLGIQAAEALEHAHQMGVVHRDIKPSNLMVDAAGHLWVTDFGLAMTQTEMNLTMTGDVLGTLRYMSPEQAAGKSRVLDHHTDIYSLGVTLYELLTLQPAFSSDNRQELTRQVLAEDPSRPRQLNRSIPSDLETIVLKAMAKEPQDRYATAQEFADDLKRFSADEPIHAKRPSLVARAAKWSRRHRAVVLAASIVLLMTAVTSMVSTVLIADAYEREKSERLAARRNESRALNAEDVAKVQEGLAREQRQLAVGQRKDALRERDASYRNLYVAHIRLAAHDWESGQISRLHQMLDVHVPEPGRDDLRGWEWYYLLGLCHSDLLTMRGHQASVCSVAWSSTGKRIASGSVDGSVRIWDATTGNQIFALRRSMSAVRSVDWSRDGRLLASGADDGTLTVWDAETGEERCLLRDHSAALRCAVWSPDDLRLASADREGTINIWDVHAPEQVLSWRTKPANWTSLAWNPDGTRLASSREEGVKIWDAASGRELVSWGGWEIYSIAWSPDGQRLASGSYLPCVQLWEASTGRQEIKIPTTDAVMSVAWSPDGKLVAGATQSQEITAWDATTGEESFTLQGHSGAIWSVAWSPEGSNLVSGGSDGTVKLWAAGKRQNPLVLDHEKPHGVAWSPDGSRMATSGGGFVKIWNPSTGELISTIESTQNALAWSSTGEMIAIQSSRHTVKIWHVEEGREVTFDTPAEINPAAVQCSTCMSWEPEDKRLAVAVGDTVRLYDATIGQERLSMLGHNGYVYSVRWSPDGRHVASTAYDGTVRIWDPETGNNLSTLYGHESGCWLSGLAWSPDSTRLASCGADRVIKVWDTLTGSELRSLEGHVARIWALAWSPDGKRLASGGVDGAIKIWCPATGEELFTLDDLDDYIRGLEWSPDGKFLAAAAPKTGVKIWDASQGCTFANSTKYLADLQINRASNSLREGAFNEAVADCTEAIRLDPTLLVAYRHRGRARAALQQWHEAASDFDRAIELGNGCYDSYSSALLQLAVGDCEAYASHCRDMLARFADTRDADTAAMTAWTCVLGPSALPTPAQAVRVAEKAIRDDPMEPMRLTTYGAALYRAGRFGEAVQILGKAAEVGASESGTWPTSPAYVYVCFFLALAHHRLGDVEEAGKWFHEAERSSGEAFQPDESITQSFALTWNRGLTLKVLREEADALLKTKTGAAPPDDLSPAKNAQAILANALVARAYPLWLEQGKRDDALLRLSKAITILRELVADFPEEPIYQADLALACKARGKASGSDFRERSMQDLTEAIGVARKLAATSPDIRASHFGKWSPAHLLARALSWRALLLTEAGKLDEAIADCNEAISSDSTYSEAYRHRAEAYSKKRDVENAIADYREAIRLNAKDGEAQTELSKLLDKERTEQDPKPQEKRDPLKD